MQPVQSTTVSVMAPPKVLRVGPWARNKLLAKLSYAMKIKPEQRKKFLMKLAEYEVMRSWQFSCRVLAIVQNVVFPVFAIIKRSTGGSQFAVIEEIKGKSAVYAVFVEHQRDGSKSKKFKEMPRESVYQIVS
ncbi:hypothetical protein K0U07_05305 [bacterium]|nr:hypothetical protein [bacterium]